MSQVRVLPPAWQKALGGEILRTMGQENIGVARALYPGEMDLVAVIADPAAVDAVRPLIHPDVEMVQPAGEIPVGPNQVVSESSRATAYGIEGFVSAWLDFLSAWERWNVRPADFIEADDERVLVLLDVEARSKTHQVDIPFEAANLLTFRDGKVSRVELYTKRQQALEAAGLRE